MRFDNAHLEQTAASGIAFAADLKREILLKNDELGALDNMMGECDAFRKELETAYDANQAHIHGMETMVKAIEQGFPKGDLYRTNEDVAKTNEVAERFKHPEDEMVAAEVVDVEAFEEALTDLKGEKNAKPAQSKST